MLSHHELATLILVKSSPDEVALDREELAALLQREFVHLETLPGGAQLPHITNQGRRVLRTIAHADFGDVRVAKTPCVPTATSNFSVSVD